MKRKTNIAGLLLILGAVQFINPLHAQQELSLMDAIQAGLENNFDIRISEQDIEIARNNNAWGTAGLWPAISVGVNQRNRYDDMPSIQDPESRNKYYTNSVNPYINLNWSLFRGLAVHASKQQLALLEQFSEGNAAVVVENAIQGIILGYYSVLLDQEKLKILEDVKQLSSDRFTYENYKKELGAAVTYDVLQAKNSFLQDSTNYLLQEMNLQTSRLGLKLLLGESPEVQYVLTDEFEVLAYELSLDSLMSEMLSNNSNLRNQYINQEILKKDITLAKSAVWPYLSMNAGFDQFNNRLKYTDADATYSNNLDYYVNFTLGFNLSNGGNTRRAIQNAKIAETIGVIQVDQLTQGLSNAMVTSYDLYTIRKQLLEVAVANLESNELNLQISAQKFRSGAINSFNYRDVQLQYLLSAFNKLEATYNLIDSHTDLLRLTGSIIQEY